MIKTSSIFKLTQALLLLTFSTLCLAGKPTSVKYVEDLVVNNSVIYSHYRVTCSDGKVADISAWDRQTKWCVGKGRQDNCSRQQIKAAKKVCR